MEANGEGRNGRNRKVERKQLEPLVLGGMSLAKIGDALGISDQSVRRWIARYDLPRPIDVRRQRVLDAVQNGSRELMGDCRRHGRTGFAIVGSEQRLRCKRCRSEAVERRRRKVKELLVDEAGGRCVLCGYHKCLRALEFHHRDPVTKSFGVAMRGITRAIDDVRAEVAKCVLLCSNCHAEVEAGVTPIP